MNIFLEIYNLARLHHEKTEILNRLVTSKETERVIKHLPRTNVQDQMLSLVNATKHLEKNPYQSFKNDSKKQRRMETFQTHL